MNDKTITIYNYHKTDKVESWKRTVINGVENRKTTAKSVSSSGAIVMTPVINVVIPYNADASGRKYIDYVEYLKLSESDVDKYWTVNPKCNKEVIVCGVCDKDICDTYKISQLKEDYYKAGIISAFDDNTEGDLLKHYKVVCK